MMPAVHPDPFDSSRHIFEIAWDGLRALMFIERSTVRIQDRFGRDITRLYPEFSVIGADLNGSGHILDGEVVSLDSSGRPSFSLLQPRLTAEPQEIACFAADTPAVFQAFDVLYLNGRPVMNEPLRTRKRMLRQTIRKLGLVAMPDHVETDGVAFFEAARQHELAGIVAKELESPYVPGSHSRAWQLIRVYAKDEFVIGGFTYGGPTRVRAGPYRGPAFHSLIVGQYDRWGQLHVAAEVTGEFSEEAIEQMSALFDRVTTTRCPFSEPPRPERLVFWCEPIIAATIAFAERTADGKLRFPKFETLRPDVPAPSCRAPAI